jgi:hypothetical protein
MRKCFKIDWVNGSEITFRPFEPHSHLDDNDTETVLLTSGEISIDVKSVIRGIAVGRQIKIITR